LKLRILLAAALAIPTAMPLASGARADDMKGMDMSGAHAKAKPAASPADKAFATSMATMMKGMNVKPTGKPDTDFVRMMMPHHQGAVDMAKVELQYGTDPELRQLATDIVAAQEKELAQMKAWLDKNAM
jgi:uncharacterized protein (DUF305 family)